MADPGHHVMVEQQLFDVHTHLDIKRVELELVAAQLMHARHSLVDAEVRLALAETPLAQSEYSTARRRLHDLEVRHAQTQLEVDGLVTDQDALIARLVV